MRIKERKDNWRASAILKRDFRHDHGEFMPKFSHHKNTNKWCRDKIGIKHEVNWRKETWLFGMTMYVGRCINCHKKMYKDRLPRA